MLVSLAPEGSRSGFKDAGRGTEGYILVIREPGHTRPHHTHRWSAHGVAGRTLLQFHFMAVKIGNNIYYYRTAIAGL